MSTASWIAERARETAKKQRAAGDEIGRHVANAFDDFADEIDAESRRIDVERGMLPG